MGLTPNRGDDAVIVREEIPAFGSKLGDDVLGGKAAREQPRDECHPLPLGELVATGWVHRVSNSSGAALRQRPLTEAAYGRRSATRIPADDAASGVMVASAPSVAIAA